jgi:hypothetical protein
MQLRLSLNGALNTKLGAFFCISLDAPAPISLIFFDRLVNINHRPIAIPALLQP